MSSQWINKGDEITKRAWNPTYFVRVGWVNYQSDGTVSVAGITNDAKPYAVLYAMPGDFIPWVKPNPFPFQANDVLECVNTSGEVFRRVLVVRSGDDYPLFNAREFNNGKLSKFTVQFSKELIYGARWRKVASTKVMVGNVPTKFITERRAPKKGERYMSELDLPGEVGTAAWDFSIACNVIIGEA